MINRIPSEWAFQLFLQEASSASSNANSSDSLNPPRAPTPPVDIPKDSEEYQTFLKNQLNLECAAAAAALSQATCPNRQPSPASLDQFDEHCTTLSSISSRDASDDENECDIELDEHSEAKRLKRMISNRESARRSRKRKQEQLTELENQIVQLKAENSSLSERLADVSEKYSEASTTNRVLTADIETLRTKIESAEAIVKSVTGMTSSTGTAVPERGGNALQGRRARSFKISNWP